MTTVQSPAEGDASAPKRGCVLLVERDPHARDLATFFLQRAGYMVRFAADGESALEMVRRERPAIVITEILLPRLDGLGLCRAIKSDPALEDTIVLVFSVLAAFGRARAAGADAFIMKPLAERKLVETVGALLARRPPAAPPSAPPSAPRAEPE